MVMWTNTKENFWSRVEKRGEGECWEWQGTMGSTYGVFKMGGKMHSAHRLAWIFTFGEIPKDDSYHGICVLHKCDNPKCVNPYHLFLGTAGDNNRDRDKKGRSNHPTGERHPGAKLTEKEIIDIRKKYSTGNYTQQELADLYQVTRSNISNIVTNSSWLHI